MNLAESKKLKPGDKLIYIGEFAFIDEDETIATKGREGHHYFWPEEVSLSPLSPANVTKNAEPAPKYDPCRRFRKGDKVRVVEWNMRSIARIGQIGYVVSDENNSIVEFSIEGWKDGVFYPACHLKLVTPVEEMRPYSVRECKCSKSVEVRRDNSGRVCAVYTEATAKAAAEAECDRLNEQYRKEQSNE